MKLQINFWNKNCPVDPQMTLNIEGQTYPGVSNSIYVALRLAFFEFNTHMLLYLKKEGNGLKYTLVQEAFL